MVGGDRNLFVRKGGDSQKKIGKHCVKTFSDLQRWSLSGLPVGYPAE